jgi:tol-pal system protein YbgF
MHIRFLLPLLLCFAIGATPALAQSKKELAAQNFALSQRLTALENRMLTGDPAAERLMQRMDALEASQRSMTGELERLRYERDTLQEEIRAMAADMATMQETAEEMRRHLKAVDIVAAAPATVPGIQTNPDGSRIYGGGVLGGGSYDNGSSLPNPPTILNPPTSTDSGNDVTKLAQLGQDRLAQGDFTGSQTAFRQYLDLNANAPDRGDVYFWLGETYFAKGGYADAADAYIDSMRTAPQGPFAPEAMVKLAGTARALGKNDVACQTLASFPTQYPSASPDVREKARVEYVRSGC